MRRLALELGDHAGEGPPDQLGGVRVDVAAVQAADVVGLEDLGERAVMAGSCYPAAYKTSVR